MTHDFMMRAATAVVVAAAIALYFIVPHGVEPKAMHAAALVLLTVGLWALGSVPEHITGLIFFLFAMIFAIATPQAVFSGFASATMWLVLGGLFIAHAVGTTGLGGRFAAVLFDRYTSNYLSLLAAVAVAATLLAILMPATVARVLLLVPIVAALAERVGFARSSNGYHGLVLAAILITYQSGTGILPASAPNLVLAGAAEAVHNVHFIYAEWLWVMFPVLALVKGILAVALIRWVYPATLKPRAARPAHPPMSAEERRLAVILGVALVLWATDFAHGVRPGWVALGAAVVCLLPRAGVLPFSAFNEVRFGPFFYVGATIGLGALAQESGLGTLLGNGLQATLDLRHGADFSNFMQLSVLNTVISIFTTNPAQPALLTPLAGQFAEAAGWPIKAALMTIAVGFNFIVLPYQVPPAVIGMRIAGVGVGAALRVTLPLAAIGIALLPLDYLWWRLIGYFG